MEISKQTQQAGDNSQLVQAQTVIIQNGITEQRAREIFDEKIAITKRDLTVEAIAEAQTRINKLEENLIPKMQKIDEELKSFADPSFQMLLVEAQKSAASSEREEDYDLLSELLVKRISSGEDRNERAGIHHAIQIVDNISSSALQALTLFHISCMLKPNQDLKLGLKALNEEYGKFMDLPLPLGADWIEHLDLLRAIRINSFGRFPSIEDFIARLCEDFAEAGIKKDSDTYNEAIKLLSSCGLNGTGVFIDNPVFSDYVRINISSKDEIDTLSLHNNIAGPHFVVPLNNAQKNALKSIRNMYIKDSQLLKQMKEWVVEQWGAFHYLNKFSEWWKQIPISFDITAAGRILANANANRIDSTISKIQ